MKKRYVTYRRALGEQELVHAIKEAARESKWTVEKSIRIRPIVSILKGEVNKSGYAYTVLNVKGAVLPVATIKFRQDNPSELEVSTGFTRGCVGEKELINYLRRIETYLHPRK